MDIVGILVYSILFIALVIAIVILITNKKDSNVKKDDYIIDEPKVRPSLKRYIEIELGDSTSKVISCLGNNYTRDLLSNGVVRLTWKEVYGGSSFGVSGMRFYDPQVTKKVVVKFKDNKVIELRANNL